MVWHNKNMPGTSVLVTVSDLWRGNSKKHSMFPIGSGLRVGAELAPSPIFP
jgi:hypothetical protein